MAEVEQNVGTQTAAQARELVFSSEYGPQERRLVNLMTNRQSKKEDLGNSLNKYNQRVSPWVD